jgi:hypothetical protein
MADGYLVQEGAAATVLPAPGGGDLVGGEAQCGDPIYVYAIVGSEPLELPSEGIDPLRPVTVLRVGPIQAVISAVRVALFGEAAVRRGLDDKAWLATHVLAHQRVLDTLVSGGLPLIPMRFCTIYADRQALEASLSRHGAAFEAELQRLRGKQEWGLKQIVDIQVLQTAIGAGHPALEGIAATGEIEKLRKQVAGMSPGAAFLLKKRLTNLIAESAQTVAYGVADETLRELQAVALEAITIDPPKDRPVVCLNAAFWVEVERWDEFMACLERLASAYAAVGVRYELSGPWPAHHFLRLALESEEGEA